jgi:hypothetical protein
MTDSNMAGSAFDSFLDPFFDGDVFFSGSVSGNSYSDPDPLYSSPSAESSSSLTDGNAMNDFGRFLDSFNFDGVNSCLGPTQKSEYYPTSESLPIEQPFVCGFRHCRFKTPSWELIVDHMGTTHFLATVSQSNCWCRTCGYVFGRKQVRDRHRISQHRRKRFFVLIVYKVLPFSEEIIIPGIADYDIVSRVVLCHLFSQSPQQDTAAQHHLRIQEMSIGISYSSLALLVRLQRALTYPPRKTSSGASRALSDNYLPRTCLVRHIHTALSAAPHSVSRFFHSISIFFSIISTIIMVCISMY